MDRVTLQREKKVVSSSHVFLSRLLASSAWKREGEKFFFPSSSPIHFFLFFRYSVLRSSLRVRLRTLLAAAARTPCPRPRLLSRWLWNERLPNFSLLSLSLSLLYSWNYKLYYLATHAQTRAADRMMTSILTFGLMELGNERTRESCTLYFSPLFFWLAS